MPRGAPPPTWAPVAEEILGCVALADAVGQTNHNPSPHNLSLPAPPPLPQARPHKFRCRGRPRAPLDRTCGSGEPYRHEGHDGAQTRRDGQVTDARFTPVGLPTTPSARTTRWEPCLPRVPGEPRVCRVSASSRCVHRLHSWRA